MINIYSLSPEKQKFFADVNTSGKNRELITSLALASAVANRLVLPTSLSDDLSGYYRTICSIDVRSDISRINELLLLDVDTVLSYVEKFYAIRYMAVYPPSVVLCANGRGVLDFFNITKALDEVAVNTITQAGLRFTILHNGFKKFFEEQ